MNPYVHTWTCTTSGAVSSCTSTSTPDGAVFTQDAGNLTFGIASLVFFDAIIFFGLIFTIFAGGRNK